MKRGWWSVLVTFLLSLPIVSADESLLGLFLGTNNDSVIFLRLIYGMLLFVFIYKVSKESIFKESGYSSSGPNLGRLGLVFSLCFVFIAEHFTSDEVLLSFGWLVAFIGPLIIIYGLTGAVIKQEQGRFSWGRLLLTAILGAVLFIGVGAFGGFSENINGMPGIGPGLDEFLQDAHYLLFYDLAPFWIAGLVALLMGLLLWGGSKLFSGSSSGGSLGGFPWKWVLGILGVILLAMFIIGLFGSGFLSIPLPGLDVLGYILLAAAIIWLMWFMFQKDRWGKLYRWIKANPSAMWVLGVILLILLLSALLYVFGPGILGFLGTYGWWILGALAILLLLWFLRNWLWRHLRKVPGMIKGNLIFVDVIYNEWDVVTKTGKRVRVKHDASGNDRTLQFKEKDPPSQLRFEFRYGHFRYLWSTVLPDAEVKFTLKNDNGSLSGSKEANKTSNADGYVDLFFTPAKKKLTNELSLHVTHPKVDPTASARIDTYKIKCGEIKGSPHARIMPDDDPIEIHEGEDCRFRVELAQDAAFTNGKDLNDVEVEVFITPSDPTIGSPQAFTGKKTERGGPGSPAFVEIEAKDLEESGQPYNVRVKFKDIDGFKKIEDADLPTARIVVLPKKSMKIIATWGPKNVPPGEMVAIRLRVVDKTTGLGIEGIRVTHGVGSIGRTGRFSKTDVNGYATQIDYVAGRVSGYGSRVGRREIVYFSVRATDDTLKYDKVEGSSIQINVDPSVTVPYGFDMEEIT